MKRGLILDFGGVVTTDFYGAMRAFCGREGLPSNAVEDFMRSNPEGRDALAAVESGKLTQRDFEQALADGLGVSANGLLGRVLADLAPCEPVMDFVSEARSLGIRTAVLSNSWGTGDYDPYAGYDLERHFDAVVISDRVGLRKPDPAIYQVSADKLGIAAENCVFVDDTSHNLPPAADVGMETVYFTDWPTGVAEIRQKLGINGN